MARTPVERRFQRIAAYDNAKAARLGSPGRVSTSDLFRVLEASKDPETGDYRCAYCGIGVDPMYCSFDHVLPYDRGGTNWPENLAVSCRDCNRDKFTKTPEEFERWRELMRTGVACAECGTVFRPPWGEWIQGRGRYCSRRCTGAVGGRAYRPSIEKPLREAASQ